MEFENHLMRIILNYCDENQVKGMTAEEVWQLAKKIAKMSKPKTRNERLQTQSRI